MLRIGIVGAGGMGTVHYNNFLHLNDCQVVGIVTRSQSGRAKAVAWGVPAFGSIAELAAAVDPDVVDVCTPTFCHKQDVLESLSLGKNTIVEKPCALHEADARQMFDLAREKGVHLYVAQVLQFSREIEVLRTLVEQKTYGEPLDAVFQRLSARPDWAQGGWLFDREKSGLVPFDLHIHDLDVIASLFGAPEESVCYPCGGQAGGFRELYRWEYRCGQVNVMAEAGWLNASIPFTCPWRVYFERAMVIFDGQTVTAYPHGADPVVYDTEDPVKIPTGINVPPTGWYYRELGHFLACIRKNEDSPLVPRDRVLAVLHILEQAV
ncbi:MAG: Gfo/Idh/MocA family oxidoreductase [Eubacteriales bacterium]|nr:Gfo/Idh/MocA family oxidoreductase [Eubacteriales bacterium]